ncbi:MAG: PLP-dependent transferase [Clostridia bacterium]
MPLVKNGSTSYHGLVYAREMGGLAFSTRLRVKLLRDMGAAISPMNAWIILQGIETLPVRMERHSQNAAELARRLKSHPRVVWVNYPGLPDHPDHDLAGRTLDHGLYGSMLNFGIEGGLAAGARFINALGLWSHVANVGDVRSLVIHPASTTHQQLSPEEQRASGADPDLIRLSAGLEHVEDLWEDLSQALERAAGVRPRSRILNDEATIRNVALSPRYPDGRPKTIAVVGLSREPGRPSYRVARKLKRLGYRLIPVNPAYAGQVILGTPAVASVAEITGAVDVIQVFRAADGAVQAAREAAASHADVFWMQEGVVSEEAAGIAYEQGKRVVMNRCLFKEIQRLLGTIATYPLQMEENGAVQ